ncbi:MAG: DUF819 family protein [Bacteroidota bacterium]
MEQITPPQPFFTSDAVVLGILMVILGLIFHTSNLDQPRWKKFYRYVPIVVLAYFIPSLLHWPLGLIASHWYSPELAPYLKQLGYNLPAENMFFSEIKQWLEDNDLKEGTEQFVRSSNLYYVASRYLLPASLVFLTISIDLKAIKNLGPKALIMFGTATAGIIIGGPIALFTVLNLFPDLIPVEADKVWRGLATVAGSWIGGSGNQTAMKEVYEVDQDLFGTMLLVDLVVGQLWMAVLLSGINVRKKIDNWLKSDTSAIDALQKKVEDYRASIEKTPATKDLFVLMAVGFGAVALSHWGSEILVPLFDKNKEWIKEAGLNSLLSGFFWLIVIATTVGVGLSFTKLKKLEGVGASKWGSVFIFILVAVIGMEMNLGKIYENWALLAIGAIWMIVHVTVLFTVAKLIKAPYFFIAVGSQANIGGAASAPVVAAAFNPALAPVGALLAVLGYALGTYGAIVCAEIMNYIVNGAA